MNHSPRSDAAALSEAATQLALSTRSFEDPLDPFCILGDLLETLRELHQVAVQLANWHVTHTDNARHDRGDIEDGANAANKAAKALTLAALQLDKSWDAIDTASGITSHLIWQSSTENQTSSP